jgi:antitoxin component of RelBE/YafQ-DinJ toxin-antitoxin module
VAVRMTSIIVFILQLSVETSDRTVKAFTEYIKENAKIPFELKKKEKKKEESIKKEAAAEEGAKKDEL